VALVFWPPFLTSNSVAPLPSPLFPTFRVCRGLLFLLPLPPTHYPPRFFFVRLFFLISSCIFLGRPYVPIPFLQSTRRPDFFFFHFWLSSGFCIPPLCPHLSFLAFLPISEGQFFPPLLTHWLRKQFSFHLFFTKYAGGVSTPPSPLFCSLRTQFVAAFKIYPRQKPIGRGRPGTPSDFFPFLKSVRTAFLLRFPESRNPPPSSFSFEKISWCKDGSFFHCLLPRLFSSSPFSCALHLVSGPPPLWDTFGRSPPVVVLAVPSCFPVFVVWKTFPSGSLAGPLQGKNWVFVKDLRKHPSLFPCLFHRVLSRHHSGHRQKDPFSPSLNLRALFFGGGATHAGYSVFPPPFRFFF